MRFIDRDAKFLFVPPEDVLAVAEREGAIPFDVPGVEFGHADGGCSFDAILHKHGLQDPGLLLLAEIVRAADDVGGIVNVPQAAGLKAIAQGFALLHGESDHDKLRFEIPMYDALYRWCQREVVSRK